MGFGDALRRLKDQATAKGLEAFEEMKQDAEAVGRRVEQAVESGKQKVSLGVEYGKQ